MFTDTKESQNIEHENEFVQKINKLISYTNQDIHSKQFEDSICKI